MKQLLAFLTILLVGLPASAHELSSSYLSVNLEDKQVSGYWLVQPEDMHLAITLDSNTDGIIAWREVTSRIAEINNYFQNNVQITAGDTQCSMSTENIMLEERASNIFLYLPLQGICDSTGALSIDYSPFFAQDQSHRGILEVLVNDSATSTVFSPSRTRYDAESGGNSIWQRFRIFIIEGVWHIWIGLDHILFLIALLFAGQTLSSNQNRPKPPWTETLKIRSVDILKTVTAFTVAHSITLILGTLGVISLPGILVETIIALSVAISGANVIFHFLDRIRWWFIFGFGLIHGLGFASVLGDLLTSQGVRLSSLLGFNIGVEIGQLCIVAAALPVIVLLERRDKLNVAVTTCVGIGIGLTGLYWAVSRALL